MDKHTLLCNRKDNLDLDLHKLHDIFFHMVGKFLVVDIYQHICRSNYCMDQLHKHCLLDSLQRHKDLENTLQVPFHLDILGCKKN